MDTYFFIFSIFFTFLFFLFFYFFGLGLTQPSPAGHWPKPVTRLG
jgi:hypothetical protein